VAWVEQRGVRLPYWRVMWREAGTRESEKFPTAAQAEYYRQLIAANGDRRVALAEAQPTAAIVAIAAPAPTVAQVSFTEWARLWIETYSGPRETTLVKYRSVIERDLIPTFGGMDVAEISRQHDSAWIRAQQAAGSSAKTIHNKHGLLYQIMQAAVECEPVPLRARNPITARLPEITTAEQRFLTPVEFARLEAAMHPQYRPFIRLLVGTGVRYAEAAGLLVGRVRLLDDPPAIDIRQSWQKQASGSWALSPLKSKSAVRSIRLSAIQVEDLIPLTAPHLAADDFVFRTVNGKPLHHGYFWTAYWTPAVRAAGLQGLRVHDLRHTHVAWLIQANTPLPVIMRRLGHASIAITIDRYGHLMPEVDASAADAMQRALVRP
jgi:integrase